VYVHLLLLSSVQVDDRAATGLFAVHCARLVFRYSSGIIISNLGRVIVREKHHSTATRDFLTVLVFNRYVMTVLGDGRGMRQ
jgi:hypothetical protein